jgi:hypothetical protein
VQSGRFWLANSFFSSVDSEILYAMIRHLNPKRIVEIGSGYSTLIMVQALAVNAEVGATAHIRCIDPFPRDFIGQLAGRGQIELIREPIERAFLHALDDLSPGDVLFIDSSHALRTGGDVYWAFLEIIPRLCPGCYIHVHDIFLPHDYPRKWVLDNHWFWNEQYLLQGFLAFNTEFEVVLALAWLHYLHSDRLIRSIPSYDPATVLPGSFWMRRRSD